VCGGVDNPAVEGRQLNRGDDPCGDAMEEYTNFYDQIM